MAFLAAESLLIVKTVRKKENVTIQKNVRNTSTDKFRMSSFLFRPLTVVKAESPTGRTSLTTCVSVVKLDCTV